MTLVVGLVFLLQNFGPLVGSMNDIYCSVNVDGVLVLLGGDRDTLTPHDVIKLIELFALSGRS